MASSAALAPTTESILDGSVDDANLDRGNAPHHTPESVTIPDSRGSRSSEPVNRAGGPLFSDLALPAALLRAVRDLGFTEPTEIQAAAIPALLAGRDITGVAQTGTGKTAAFGLPLLAAVDAGTRGVQALVLTPTRELAMQVAAAISSFAAQMPGLTVVPVYGGAPFLPQRAALRSGAQVVVGTPGRVIDHLERHTLDLSGVRFLVLDEADEMLRMGFAEDVDKILSQAPEDRQTALFSATMPASIRGVAGRHLRRPLDISLGRPSATIAAVRQTYAVLPFRDKTDALVRVLQVAPGDATIVFVRTKTSCDEVGAELIARGISAAAINGDVPQAERERIIDRLRTGRLDVLVATDVAARGLDVDRIDLVVNFDAPGEAESYVHRIGRTGRAGRGGEALTFFTPREISRLRAIEKATRHSLEQVTPPSAADVAAHRATSVLAQVMDRAQAGRLAPYRRAVAEFAAANELSDADLAAILLALAAGDDGALPVTSAATFDSDARGSRTTGGSRADGAARPRRERPPAGPRYWVAVGREHGVRPAGIVGAITAEGGLAGSDLGRIDIYDTYSTVEIAGDIAPAALARISRAKVSGQLLQIRPDGARPVGAAARGPAGHGPSATARWRSDGDGGHARTSKKPRRLGKLGTASR